MKIAVFTVMLGGEYDMASAANIVAKWGFDGIEWRIHNDYHVPVTGIEKAAERAADLARESGLEVCAFAPYVQARETSALETIFAAAAATGCPAVRVCVPGFNEGDSYRALFDETRRSLEKVASLAAKHGVKGQIELHMGTIAPSAALGKRLVAELDPSCIGVIFDPGNMVIEGKENWQMGLQLLGPHLSHVHVKNAGWFREDGKPGLRSPGEGAWKWRWTPLLEGIVDWPQVIRDLRAVGYAGYLSLEDFSDQPVEQRLEVASAALRQMIAETEER